MSATLPPETALAIDAACRQSLAAFYARAFRIIEPGTALEWNWHLGCIAEHLEAAERGEITRLVVNMPPRALKTSTISVMFPAWILGRTPHERFITTSFKFDRAVSMSLKCRHILNDVWYQACFPTTRIDPAQGQKHNFHTTQRGQYYASAILSVTGEGGNYIIVDDPIAPSEAQSETIRNTTNETIRGTLFSRFNDSRTGRFILVMQRLHEDDATGNLLKDQGYHLLKLPAEAKVPVSITLGQRSWEMQQNELLFPSRLSREVLDQKRVELTDYHYAGQYLQEPIPAGGGEFKGEWVQYYQGGTIKPKTMNIVILCDPAGGDVLQKRKGKLSDWTAYMVVGLAPDQNYYLLDIVRDRLNPTERINTLFLLHRKWNELGGRPPKVGYEKYGMMTDTHYLKQKQDYESYRFPVIELGGSMIKEERIRRLIPDMQMGRWYFPSNLMYCDNEGRTFDLVDELVGSEMASFPRARFDDMLDALSRVYENDLLLTFPSIKSGAKQAIHRAGEAAGHDNWMSF